MQQIYQNAYFGLILFGLLACQEPKKESSNAKHTPKQASQNAPKAEKVRKKVTFEDIKDRFLHKNPTLVPIREKDFYNMVSFPPDTCPNLIYAQDLNDLGLDTTQYKHLRVKYFAYSLHEFKKGYWLGIASGGEYATSIEYFWLNIHTNTIKYHFSLTSVGDGGFRGQKFAFFSENQINVHDLFSHVGNTTYKQYRLTFTPSFELRADTIQIVERKGYENDLFKEILQKYGLPSF